MPKFRLKKCIIDAIQVEKNMANAESLAMDPFIMLEAGGKALIVSTPGGEARATVGDWITVDEDGNRRVMRDADFEKYYELIKEQKADERAEVVVVTKDDIGKLPADLI